MISNSATPKTSRNPTPVLTHLAETFVTTEAVDGDADRARRKSTPLDPPDEEAILRVVSADLWFHAVKVYVRKVLLNGRRKHIEVNDDFDDYV